MQTDNLERKPVFKGTERMRRDREIYREIVRERIAK